MGIFDNDEYVDVWLDSADSNNTASTSRDAPSFIFLPAVENVVGMKVMYVSIPFTYYVIDMTNNQFDIEITADGYATPSSYASAKYRVYLQPGSYDDTNIGTMIEKVFTYAYNSSEPWDGGVEILSNASAATEAATDLSTVFNIKVIYDDTTSRMVFYVENDNYDNQLQFNVNFANCTYPAHKVLGFEDQSYSAILDTLYGNNEESINSGNAVYYVKSPYAASLSGGGLLYLHSDIHPFRYVRNATSNSDLLLAVPVNANYKGIIEYKSESESGKITFSPIPTLSAARFYWTLGTRDSYQPGADSSSLTETKYLPLQGQSFVMCIRFFIRADTVQRTMLNQHGDRFITSESQNEGSRYPQETRFNRNDVKTRPQDNRGNSRVPKMAQLTSTPMGPPSRYKRART